MPMARTHVAVRSCNPAAEKGSPEERAANGKAAPSARLRRFEMVIVPMSEIAAAMISAGKIAARIQYMAVTALPRKGWQAP
jgi:hypothetical protein